MAKQNIQDFQESITLELMLTKDRVEFLIGDANWGEVGRYKEAILRKTIAQFLPSNLKIGTGFIVGNRDHLLGQEGHTSSQLDIIIYEDRSPVIFREGDFVIITESSVRAVIEVKTKIVNYSNTDTLADNALNTIASKINTLKRFESFNAAGTHRKKFVGIFSFEYDQNISSERVDEALRVSGGTINHLSLGPHNFIKYWENTLHLEPRLNHTGKCYIRYLLNNLSFSYFISNLLHIVSDEDPVERYWFSFPIPGTKELYRHLSKPIVEIHG